MAEADTHSAADPLESFPWRRNLWIVWASQFIAMIGMTSGVTLLPIFVRDLAGTDIATAQQWAGLVQSGPFFVSILTIPLWGKLGDKYGRKKQVLRALAGLVLVMSLMGFVRTVEELFVLRLIQGGITGFIASALALVSTSTPKKHSGYAISVLQTATSSGAILGPLAGGVVVDTFGIRAVFGVVAVLCFLSFVVAAIFVREVRTPGVTSEQQSLRQTISYVWRRRDLRKILLMIAAAQGGIVFSMPVYVFFLAEVGAPKASLATLTGILAGSVGIASTLIGPLWGKLNDRYGWRFIILRSAAPASLAMILQTAVTSYLWLFPIRATVGLFASALIPSLYAALNKTTSAENKGTIMSLASSANLVGNLVAPALSGLIASSFGLRWCFVASSSIVAGVWLAAFLSKGEPAAAAKD